MKGSPVFSAILLTLALSCVSHARPPTLLQPVSLDAAALATLFRTPGVPSLESLEGCEQPLIQLRKLSQRQEVITQGARELVLKDAARMHWCFHRRVLKMEEALAAELSPPEQQRIALEAFHFLTPIARGFLLERRETIYMERTLSKYHDVSDKYFFRRVEVQPQLTLELLEASRMTEDPPPPLMAPLKQRFPVLEKFGLLQ